MENISLVYRNKWIIDFIQNEVASTTYAITRTDKLEGRVIRAVTKYLSKNKDNVKHRRYIRSIVLKEISQAKKLYGNQHADYFQELDVYSNDGDVIAYDPVDVLANVESGLEIKEAITLLAKGDRKREMILTEWAKGSTNDSELSNTLASVFGGQARSHRIFIQRFRIECQSNYYSLAI